MAHQIIHIKYDYSAFHEYLISFQSLLRWTVKIENTIMHSHGCPSLVLSDITLDSPTDLLTVFQADNAHWSLRTSTYEFCSQNINMSNLFRYQVNNYEFEIQVKRPVHIRCKILYAMKRRARFREMKSPAYYFSVAQARACVF